MHSLKLKTIALFLTVISLTGCMGTNTHKKLIQSGYNPKIAVVTAIPNELSIEYFGYTAFGNNSSKHPTSIDLNNLAIEEASRLLQNSSKIRFTSLDSHSINELETLLPGKLRNFRIDGPSEESLRAISNWGIDKNLEYLALIVPGKTSYNYTDFTGLLCIAGADRRIITFGIYSIYIIDIEKRDISYKAQENMYYKSLGPSKDLSSSQIKDIRSKWEDEQRNNDNTLIQSSSAESAIEQAKFFTGKDYQNLDQENVDRLVTDFLPTFRQEIEKLLSNAELL